MLDVAILGQVAFGYSPFIDKNRSVTATRLTVFPLKPDMVPDAAQLLHAVGGVWPADGGRVSLNVTSESLLQDLMQAQPSGNVMVEIPAFMACDPANTAAIVALRANGNVLMLKGRPLQELPREVLPCFKYSVIDVADDRRSDGSKPPPGVERNIPHVQAGVRTIAEMEQSFARGAEAVLGWPIDDVVQGGNAKSRAELAQTELARAQKLLESRAVSRQEFDQLSSGVRTSEAPSMPIRRFAAPAGTAVQAASRRKPGRGGPGRRGLAARPLRQGRRLTRSDLPFQNR